MSWKSTCAFRQIHLNAKHPPQGCKEPFHKTENIGKTCHRPNSHEKKLDSARAILQHQAQTVGGGGGCHVPSSHVNCIVPFFSFEQPWGRKQAPTHFAAKMLTNLIKILANQLLNGCEVTWKLSGLQYQDAKLKGLLWLHASSQTIIPPDRAAISQPSNAPRHSSSRSTAQLFSIMQSQCEEENRQSGFKGRNACYLQLKRLSSCRGTKSWQFSLPKCLHSLESMHSTRNTKGMTLVSKFSWVHNKTGINVQLIWTVENLLLYGFIPLQAKTAFRQGTSPQMSFRAWYSLTELQYFNLNQCLNIQDVPKQH